MPLFINIRHYDKIRYNDNLTGMKRSMKSRHLNKKLCKNIVFNTSRNLCL